MQRFHQLHQAAPKLWRHTHSITGDYAFDASIEHCTNPDMRAKLDLHLSGASYGPKTAYNGYNGLAGDD